MWHVAAWLPTLWVCQTIFLHHMWSYRVIRFFELYQWIYEVLWVYQCLWHTRSKRASKVTPKMPKDFNLWSQRQRFSNPTRLVLHCVLSRTCTVPDVAVCKSLQEDYHQLCGPQMSSWQNAVKAYKFCIDYPALFIQIFSRFLEDIIDTVRTGEWLLSWMFFCCSLHFDFLQIAKIAMSFESFDLQGFFLLSSISLRYFASRLNKLRTLAAVVEGSVWGFCRTWPRESVLVATCSCVIGWLDWYWFWPNLFLWRYLMLFDSHVKGPSTLLHPWNVYFAWSVEWFSGLRVKLEVVVQIWGTTNQC